MQGTAKSHFNKLSWLNQMGEKNLTKMLLTRETTIVPYKSRTELHYITIEKIIAQLENVMKCKLNKSCGTNLL